MPDEGETSPTEDTMTYLMSTGGKVYLVNTQSEEPKLPYEAATERTILLNERPINASPVFRDEADRVVHLAQLATRAAQERRR